MRLHSDLSAFLELVELGRLAGKSQPLHLQPLAQARSDFEASSQILDPNPPGAVSVDALSLPMRDGAQLPARLYRAAGQDETRLPVILYLHGGGYVVGSLDSHDSVCRRLALDGRFAVLAPAYRLAPEHPFPTAVEDAEDSLKALPALAEAWNLDLRRVALAGDSAGATLATVLAMVAAREPQVLGVQPLAQLLFYPVTDISTTRDSHRRYGEGYLLERETLEWFYAQYVTDAAQRLDWRVSPLLGDCTAAQVPAYIAVAGHDPLRDEGLAYAEQLRAGGTAVTLRVEEELSHDFLRMGGIVAEVEGLYADALDWLAVRQG
ncbi:alpha/beta hydrolase [Pseudomonas juntendi]|uniref:alpha/beta hydrolase n=1 Tax=Pseudomonas TaxID=286 RepID=UPI0034D62C11